MKTFKVVIAGEAPASLVKMFSAYDGKEAKKDAKFCLDQDITFVVCDLKEAHGNMYSDSAWLSPKNGDCSWNIDIKF